MVFARDADTGELSSATLVAVLDMTSAVQGVISGLAVSAISGKLFVSMADYSEGGGLAVFTVEVSRDTTTARHVQIIEIRG